MRLQLREYHIKHRQVTIITKRVPEQKHKDRARHPFDPFILIATL